MDLLIMLVERRGQLVSREDIVDRLWGKDVFVDVETGVHTAVRKIRRALRDSPEKPAFIETVSGKGYRFIAPVEVVRAAPPTRAGRIRTAASRCAVPPPARAWIGIGWLAVAVWPASSRGPRSGRAPPSA